MLRCLTLLLLSAILAEGAPGTFRRGSGNFRIAPFFSPLIAFFNVASSSISLTSSDPDAGGNVATNATWGVPLGVMSDTWNITVAAGASSFTNCPQVSLGAVTVKCTSVAVSGIAAIGTTTACGSSFLLSSTPKTLASGTDGTVLAAIGQHTINLNVTFADSWKNPATISACTISLNYTLTVI